MQHHTLQEDIMKKYDTVIFDLDGTLLNTLDDLTDSVNHALTLNGYPVRETPEIRSFLGNGIGKLIELSIPEGLSNPQYEKCLADFRDHYLTNMRNKTGPYNGIMELLEQLDREGYKLAIVSNKFDPAVKELNQIYFEKYIKVAIGETKDIAKKPAPDTVLEALKELNSTVDKAVYVGDSEVDVQTAKNANMTCIGVTWGFRDRDVLEEGAEYIINKPNEILSVLDK